MQMAKGPFPPGGDVGLGTIVCDCHSLAVCIPEKLSPGLFQLAWVLALSFTVLITGRSRQMKKLFSPSANAGLIINKPK